MNIPLFLAMKLLGRLPAIGSQVKDRHVGQRVGVGFQAGYCKTCECCYNGDHNLCEDRVGVFVGRNGGFADKVRVQDISAIPIPDALDPGQPVHSCVGVLPCLILLSSMP